MANKSGYKLSALISILGLVTLLAALVVMVTLPAIRLAAWAILALGVGLLIIAFILDFRTVAGAVTGRRGKFSTGTTVMASIFVGITLLVNAISIGAYHRFDTTGLSQFTLTAQTKDVLGKMEIPVQVTAFFVPNDPLGANGYIQHLLKEYQNYTTKLTVREIDPDANPDQATKYGVFQYPTVVFESTLGRPRLVQPDEIVQTELDQQGNPQISGIEGEHAFTSAILEVTGVVQKKIYFITGHGESSVDADLSVAAQELRSNLFKVENLDLLFDHSIPEDATALVIAGPQKQYSTEELGIIQDYLVKGGWLMVMLNPNPSIDMKVLLLPWGVDVEDGMVVDPPSSLESVNNPIVPRIRNFFGMTSIYFRGATALLPLPFFNPQPIQGGTSDTPIQVVWTSDNSSIAMLSMARTSSDSWLEANYEQGKTPIFDNVTDVKGPLELALRIVLTPPVDDKGQPTGSVPPTRLVIVGDSDFATNQNFFNGDNGNFFLNLVDQALTQGKELITIQRKVLPFRRLVVSQEVFTFIEFSSIGLVPILVLLAGGVIWWRRR